MPARPGVPGLIDAPVASAPDALAAGAGAMLALLGDGTVEQGGTTGGSWTRLAAPGAIASSAAGRQCHVTSLTAVAYTPSGTPLAAASCARPGIAGIFARSGTTWQAAGPSSTERSPRTRSQRCGSPVPPPATSRSCGPGRAATRACSPPGRVTAAGGRSQPRWPRAPGRWPPPAPGPAARPGCCWPTAARTPCPALAGPGGGCRRRRREPLPWRQGLAARSRRWPRPGET